MTALSDKRAICQAIAGVDHDLTFFEHRRCQIVAGPLGALTPFCFIYFRKADGEYRIDYDEALTVCRDEKVNLQALEDHIQNCDFIWTSNTYPEGFTLSTITENKRPLPILVQRIRTFLLDHAKDESEALSFVQAGETEFLQRCRRFRPSDYDERLLAKLA
jgi:hypothetical protein